MWIFSSKSEQIHILKTRKSYVTNIAEASFDVCISIGKLTNHSSL